MSVSRFGNSYSLEGVSPEDDKEWDARSYDLFARAHQSGRLMAFVGAGVSKAYGYPLWEEFVRSLLEYVRDKLRREEVYEWSFGEHWLTREEILLTELQKAEDLWRREYKLGLKYEHQAGKKNPPRSPVEAALVQKHAICETGDGPLYDLVRELDVRRFVTTNYDACIEETLEKVLLLDKYDPAARRAGDEKRLGPTYRSLYYSTERPDELINFATSAPGHETGVFHLHGVRDEPRSLIVTERDYQRLYLREDVISRSFRDAVTLLFSSNPILFVGLSMREPDVLRPLRQFVARRDMEPQERPFFALIEKEEAENGGSAEQERKIAEYRRFLYDRYGVKAIFYPVRSDDPRERTQALRDSLQSLKREVLRWIGRFDDPPRLRAASFNRTKNGILRVVHHAPDYELDDPPFERVVQSKRDDIKKLKSSGKPIVLAGADGLGKGTLGYQLVKAADADGYTKAFFSSAHFTNEFLSSIEGAWRFLTGISDESCGKDPIEALGIALESDDADGALIVFGGIDRILEPSPGIHPMHRVQVGEPINVEARRFLEMLSTQSSGKATVVLSTSLWPNGLDENNSHALRLDGVSPDSCEGLDGAAQPLSSHTYARNVVSRFLQDEYGNGDEDEKQRWLKALCSKLKDADQRSRARLAVEEVLSSIKRPKALFDTIRCAALFPNPVDDVDLKISGLGAKGLASIRSELLERKLLLPVSPRDQTQAQPRFTAHTLNRIILNRTVGFAQQAQGEGKLDSLMDAQTLVDVVQPETDRAHQFIADCVDRFFREIESTRERRNRRTGARDRLRTVFGLLKSRYSASTISRLARLDLTDLESGLRVPHADHYEYRLSRLLDLILEQDGSPKESPPVLSSFAVLYADEMLWLYNELCHIAYQQGHVDDAYRFGQLARNIAKVIDGGSSPTAARMMRCELNLGAIEIERGNLGSAFDYLIRIVAASEEADDPTLEAKATGYLGLWSHLRGRYQEARKRYNHAIKILKRTNRRRAAAFFLRCRGDLHRLLDRSEKAERDLRDSITWAESANSPDLVHHARIALANLERKEPKLADGRTIGALETADEFARKVGLPRLQYEVNRVQGMIALSNGARYRAEQLAASCLSTATLLNLGLRQTASLAFLGETMVVAGGVRAASGLHVLEAARDAAKRRGYTLQLSKIEDQLMRLR